MRNNYEVVLYYRIALLLVIASLLILFNYNQDKKVSVTFNISFTQPKIEDYVNKVYLSIPRGRYEKQFIEVLGEDIWNEVKKQFRSQYGLRKFYRGDVLEVEFLHEKVRHFALHHYKNRSVGELLLLRKEADGKFYKETKPILLEVKTLARYFEIEKSFKTDYPDFYNIAKERLTWDWAILDQLQPGDSISFLIKGVFDNDVVVDLYGILGFSVKSEALGEFTLSAYRNYKYGDYFLSQGTVYMSPEGYFRVPIDYARISSFFGMRIDPFTKRRKKHKGIDQTAKRNANVHAARDGIVVWAGWKRLLGRTVVIEHEDNIKTIYGHLNRIYVRSGTEVRKGEIIGGVGNTGRSTNNHLHFTVLENGVAVDPLKFTYERVWTTPFDISRDFLVESNTNKMVLIDSVQEGKSYFVRDYLAKKDAGNKNTDTL